MPSGNCLNLIFTLETRPTSNIFPGNPGERATVAFEWIKVSKPVTSLGEGQRSYRSPPLPSSERSSEPHWLAAQGADRKTFPERQYNARSLSLSSQKFTRTPPPPPRQMTCSLLLSSGFDPASLPPLAPDAASVQVLLLLLLLLYYSRYRS